MGTKAVIFDLGNTLVHYTENINWSNLYTPATRQVLAACGAGFCAQKDAAAQKTLTKYNTRVHPRDYEVSSNVIFGEILEGWGESAEKVYVAKQSFYNFFQRETYLYEDTEAVLQTLKARGIKIGVLTDVPYGMDNEFVQKDLAPIANYIDLCLTSNDVGLRKPSPKGFLTLQNAFGVVRGNEIIVVGDEEKDIVGANVSGFISVLIDRKDLGKNWGQAHTIKNLKEILEDI